MSEPAVPVAESPGSIASELEDLPSPSTSESSTTEEDLQAESDAEREWRESLQQLELLLTMVIVPYFGKYFGRKAAYWGWAKYMEWRYPVSVEVTDSTIFKGTGAIEAAASL